MTDSKDEKPRTPDAEEAGATPGRSATGRKLNPWIGIGVGAGIGIGSVAAAMLYAGRQKSGKTGK